jgi:predicted nucleic acid-binding protein
MKYVLDSSVVFKWVVPETLSDRADSLRHANDELIAPDFLPLELAHALTRAERQNRIAIGEAVLFWTDAMTTPLSLAPSLPLAPRAMEIASQLRIGVYDCLYIALAEHEKCDFVTADERLVGNVQRQFAFVRHLGSLT